MLRLKNDLYVGYIANHVSAKTVLNGGLKIEIGKNVAHDEIDRDLNVAIYDKDNRLVINTMADIDLLIAKLQEVREELF